MQIDSAIKQLNIKLAQLAAQGIDKKNRGYRKIREKLDQLEKIKREHRLNNATIASNKEIFTPENKEVKIPEVDKANIITKDEDIYYFKQGIMIPEKIVERLINEAQGKSPYFVLTSLAKFSNRSGVVSKRKVEDLAKWCGYEDSSTYRFGLNWLEENDFVFVDRSTRPNRYVINDYKFGRAIIIPENDIKGEAKKVIPKELRIKWTYYLRNQHSPANKKGKLDLSLSYLKKMTNAVSFKEVLKLTNKLKDSFFSKFEIVKSKIKSAKDKLKVEFNNLRLGIVKDLDQEIDRVNHHDYFKRVYTSFKKLEIPLTLPNFRQAYEAIREVGEFCLDQVVTKSKTGKYRSIEQSVGYFIYLLKQEYSYLNL
ncbi:hypothetical protein [Orenia marismortui]|uniref:hypothetical protein n=1 Tax=Orenia marismortui TaxID=46469 RepID=UPI00036307A7|nr:hypothetical protein [Orenia marismortui]